jgi:hypothetical protein
MDNQWKSAFRDMAAQGRTDLTVRELYKEVATAINNTSDLTVRQRRTLQFMLHRALYGELRLKPDERVLLPYAETNQGSKSIATHVPDSPKVTSPRTEPKGPPVNARGEVIGSKAEGATAKLERAEKIAAAKLAVRSLAGGAALLGLGLGSACSTTGSEQAIQKQVHQGFKEIEPQIQAKLEALSSEAEAQQAAAPDTQLYAQVSVKVRVLHDLDDIGSGTSFEFRPVAAFVEHTSVTLGTERIDSPKEKPEIRDGIGHLASSPWLRDHHYAGGADQLTGQRTNQCRASAGTGPPPAKSFASAGCCSTRPAAHRLTPCSSTTDGQR